ncbi:MAG: hypothetical protein ACQGVC_16525 [Myxococcota bacterium]
MHRRSWFSIPLLLLPLSTASAEEPTPGQALVREPFREVGELSQLHDPGRLHGAEPVQETRAWDRLYLNKSGLEVRKPLTLGERRIELGVKGPLMKRKRVGLKFEVRF